MNPSDMQGSYTEVSFPVVIQVYLGFATSWVARAVGISDQGISIYSSSTVPLNVPVMLHLPFEWQQNFIIVKAVDSNDKLYSCQFVNLERKDRYALSKALNKYLSKRSPQPADDQG